jgi:serine/threonine-protein kinase
MLSGRQAFHGNSTAEILSALLRDNPRPFPASTALEWIVMQCLAKQPSGRFQAMSELRAALERVPTKTGGNEPSIAVLPFADMSPGKDNEYFSDGLAEEIINALAQLPGLKVIARTSAFAFKGQNTDIRRIAEALGVTNILEGSVRKAGNRIRVTAQLITAADGSHLWSQRYDRELADVFAIQDEIAQAIAGALQLKLVAKSAGHQPPPKLPAYEVLLLGRHHLFKFSPESFTRARECFEQAIALDPAYTEAHAYLGLGYFFMGMNGIRPLREVAHLVRAEAQKALDLKPSEIGPRFLLGGIAAAHDYDWNAAAEHFDAALAANPVVPNARWAYASFYSNPLGRFQDSVAKMQLEVEQDPLNAAWRAILASHLHHAGMHTEAIGESQKALDLDENSWVAHFNLAEIYIAQGKFAEAVAAGEKAYRCAPWQSMPAGILAAALFRAGERDRARALIQQMGDTPIPVWGRIMYHLLCSEVDAAADWYEKAIQERDPFAVVFAHAPYGKVLRESPRWPKIAKMMNLPERFTHLE